MSSQTPYSSLIFSPRPTLVGMSFDANTLFQTATTIKQDEFSYQVSSDGVEVRHPQAASNEVVDTQLLVNEEDHLLPSEEPGYPSEGVNAAVETLSLVATNLNVDKFPAAINEDSLVKRRGKDLDKLDLDAKAKDPSSWPSNGTSPSSSLLPKNPAIPSPYTVIKTMGTDSEGICSLVNRLADNKLLVIKTVQNPRLLHRKPIEARILQDLLPAPHKNIIHLQGYEYTLQPHLDHDLVRYHFEYCSGGDLHNLINRYEDHKTHFPGAFVWKVFSQLLSALEHLHRGFDLRLASNHTGIVHRDVKPENIFIRRSSTCDLKYPDIVLADFGTASLDFATYEPAGTTFFQPPEMPRKTPKGDVYSVGGVIHQMIHFTAPMLDLPECYAPTERNEYLWHLGSESRLVIRTVPELCGERLIELMLLALEKQECRRMNAKWLLRAVEEVEGLGCAEPLAEWAFEEMADKGGDDGDAGRCRSGHGYRQYMEMMGNM